MMAFLFLEAENDIQLLFNRKLVFKNVKNVCTIFNIFSLMDPNPKEMEVSEGWHCSRMHWVNQGHKVT